jgi:hypothetical protein
MAEGVFDMTDHGGDLRSASRHGIGDRAVFRVHHVDDLARRGEVDRRRTRVALLRDSQFLPLRWG